MTALKIPFDKDGNLMAHSWNSWKDTDWRDNYKFIDTLKLIEAYSSRSSAIFIFESVLTNRKYRMFLSDFIKTILRQTIVEGVIRGEWTFCKRGPHFGIKLLNL